MSQQITITVADLERMLMQQKELIIEKLRGTSYLYNKNSTAGNSIPLDIDEEKFRKEGMTARYPDEFNTLKKYVK